MISEFKVMPWGWISDQGQHLVVFGNRQATYLDLQKHFPHLQFKRMRQVHGNDIVPMNHLTPDFQIAADGCYTQDVDIALCSISADCVPLFLADSASPFVMSLHAGWRGVASRILVNALNVIRDHGIDTLGLKLWIGPHIQGSSFEVEEDALLRLENSSQLKRAQFAQPKDGKKSTVALQCLLESQMGEFGIKPSQVQSLRIDTLSDPRMHSFRRDRENAGRQVSFIVLKSSL